MPLPVGTAPVPKRSWVSLTWVQGGDLRRASASGHHVWGDASTVWPFTARGDGGGRQTQHVLALDPEVGGCEGHALLPVWGFTPSCPVIATCRGRALTQVFQAQRVSGESWGTSRTRDMCFTSFPNFFTLKTEDDHQSREQPNKVTYHQLQKSPHGQGYLFFPTLQGPGWEGGGVEYFKVNQ